MNRAWLRWAFGLVMFVVAGCKPVILSPAADDVVCESNVPPTKVAFRVRHDSGAKMDFDFQRSEIEIPGQWPQPRQPVALLPESVVHEAGTLTVATFALPQSGSWHVRVRGQESGSIWSDWRTFILLGPGQSTAAATVTASPSIYQGACPVQVYFKGVVCSAAAGQVRWFFKRSDGLQTLPQIAEFSASGTVPVENNMPVGDPLISNTPLNGSVTLIVQALSCGSEPEVKSLPAFFQVNCDPE